MSAICSSLDARSSARGWWREAQRMMLSLEPGMEDGVVQEMSLLQAMNQARRRLAQASKEARRGILMRIQSLADGRAVVERMLELVSGACDSLVDARDQCDDRESEKRVNGAIWSIDSCESALKDLLRARDKDFLSRYYAEMPAVERECASAAEWVQSLQEDGMKAKYRRDPLRMSLPELSERVRSVEGDMAPARRPSRSWR